MQEDCCYIYFERSNLKIVDHKSHLALIKKKKVEISIVAPFPRPAVKHAPHGRQLPEAIDRAPNNPTIADATFRNRMLDSSEKSTCCENFMILIPSTNLRGFTALLEKNKKTDSYSCNYYIQSLTLNTIITPAKWMQ